MHFGRSRSQTRHIDPDDPSRSAAHHHPLARADQNIVLIGMWPWPSARGHSLQHA
jgi:hypothetical protein